MEAPWSEIDQTQTAQTGGPDCPLRCDLEADEKAHCIPVQPRLLCTRATGRRIPTELGPPPWQAHQFLRRQVGGGPMNWTWTLGKDGILSHDGSHASKHWQHSRGIKTLFIKRPQPRPWNMGGRNHQVWIEPANLAVLHNPHHAALVAAWAWALRSQEYGKSCSIAHAVNGTHVRLKKAGRWLVPITSQCGITTSLPLRLWHLLLAGMERNAVIWYPGIIRAGYLNSTLHVHVKRSFFPGGSLD